MDNLKAVAKPTSKYSRVPIYPGAVYDVYALQLQSTDSFIFAQRTKLNSIFAQSLDSDLADYCHRQKPLPVNEISAGDPVVIRDKAGLELFSSKKQFLTSSNRNKEHATWRRAEIEWVDEDQANVYLVDLGTYMTVPTSRIYHISDVLIRRQQSPIIRCTLRGLVKPGYEDEAFVLLQKFCEEATVLSISGSFSNM